MNTTSPSAREAAQTLPIRSNEQSSAEAVVVPGLPWKVVKSEGSNPRSETPSSYPSPPLITTSSESIWAKVINRRYHLTIASLAYVATTCVLVIGAVNGQNNLLFWIFGIAVSGLTISGLISGSSLMGIRIKREIIETPRAGEPFHIRYTLYNANYVVGAFALVVEELPQSRGWLGKKFGSSWAARVHQPRVGVAYLGPRQTLVVECRCDAAARGRATFGPVRVSSTFPFGIARKSVTFVQDSQVIILPKRVELARDASSFASQRTQESASMIRSRNGDETFALREHAPGDPLRSVAWRASARMARPIVRDLSKRTGGRIWIVLDDGVGETSRETFERAVMMTSSMLDTPAARTKRLGFATISQGVVSDTERLGPVNVDEMLAVAEPTFGTTMVAVPQIQPTDAVVLISPPSRGRSILSIPASQVIVLDPQSASTYAAGMLPEVQLPLETRQLPFVERVSAKTRELLRSALGNQSPANTSTGGAA